MIETRDSEILGGRPYESLVADGKALEDVEAVRTIQAQHRGVGEILAV